MYNLLISLSVAFALFVGSSALVGQAIAGILPGLLVGGITYFMLARRTGMEIQKQLAPVPQLLQSRKVSEAQQLIRDAKEQHGKWQFLVSQQMDAQLGMIEYLQMHFDAALPLLEAGKWRNWTALLCLGCIHHRNGDKEARDKVFAEAQQAEAKEQMVWVIPAVLLSREGRRTDAISAVVEGKKSLPDNKLLKELQNALANKKKIDVKQLGDVWYQFFPEELVGQQVMRGRRGPQPQPPQPRNRAGRRR